MKIYLKFCAVFAILTATINNSHAQGLKQNDSNNLGEFHVVWDDDASLIYRNIKKNTGLTIDETKPNWEGRVSVTAMVDCFLTGNSSDEKNDFFTDIKGKEVRCQMRAIKPETKKDCDCTSKKNVNLHSEEGSKPQRH